MKQGNLLYMGLTLFVLAASALAGGDQQGIINTTVTWTGTNNLTGDVTVTTGGTLYLNNADHLCQVIAKGNYSLIIDGGNLVVQNATPQFKVHLWADPLVPQWGGILIKKFNTTTTMHTLENMLIEDAAAGICVRPNLGFKIYVTLNHCRIQDCGTGIIMEKLSDPSSCFRITNCSILNNSDDGIYAFNLPLKAPPVGALWISTCEIAYNGKCGIHVDRGGGALKIYDNYIHDNVQGLNPADNGITCIISSPNIYHNVVNEPNSYAFGCAVSGAPTLTSGVNTWETTNGYAVMHFRNSGGTLYKAHNNIKHMGAPPKLIYDESSPPVLRKVAYNYWYPAPSAALFIPASSFVYAPYDQYPNSYTLPFFGTSSVDSSAYNLLTEALEAEAAENFTVAYAKFLEVVEDYADIEGAVCEALPHILSTGAHLDVPYQEMYVFFDGLVQQSASTMVGKTARQCRNDCHVALQIFDEPIEDYNSIAAAPPTLADSVFALIDLDQISVIMEYLGLPGPQSYGDRPRTLQDYRAHQEELFALLDAHAGNLPVAALPSGHILLQFYPNPFNPTTTIQFTLPEGAYVSLNVYDCSGRTVASFESGWKNAGLNEVTFDGSVLASGIYLCQVKAGQYEATRKMVLLK